MEFTSTPPEVTNTIAQLNIRMTDVLIAVARLELRPDTPILASSAVTPAKKADDSAQKNHCIDLTIFPGAALILQTKRQPVRFQVIRFLKPIKKSPGGINARRFTDKRPTVLQNVLPTSVVDGLTGLRVQDQAAGIIIPEIMFSMPIAIKIEHV